MKFTQIPQDTFKELVLNAGVLLSAFSPDTAEVADGTIIGATSGGLTFAATPSFSDFGEDIDNCPKNTKELKRLESYSDKNGAKKGGYLAIHMLNGLSTGGFQLKTGDKSKGQFAFEFTGHYSITAQDTPPFEIYVKAGEAESATM